MAFLLRKIIDRDFLNIVDFFSFSLHTKIVKLLSIQTFCSIFFLYQFISIYIKFISRISLKNLPEDCTNSVTASNFFQKRYFQNRKKIRKNSNKSTTKKMVSFIIIAQFFTNFLIIFGLDFLKIIDFFRFSLHTKMLNFRSVQTFC